MIHLRWFSFNLFGTAMRMKRHRRHQVILILLFSLSSILCLGHLLHPLDNHVPLPSTLPSTNVEDGSSEAMETARKVNAMVC